MTMMTNSWLFRVLACLILLHSGTATPMRQVVYAKLTGNSGKNTCVRLLDSEGMSGCSSPQSGAKGFLYEMKNQAQVDAFENAPESRYIVILSQDLLADNTIIQNIVSKEKFKGALIYGGSSSSSPAFSPDDSIPNKNHGLPFENDTVWNTAGGGYGSDSQTGLHWINLEEKPFYYIDDVDYRFVMSKYNQTNVVDTDTATYPSHPLHSVSLKNFMYGVKDAELCLRRQLCDPLQSHNVYGTLQPLSDTQEIVMVAAQMDALALFHDLAVGSNADASGLVALIAAAHLLGDPDNIDVRSTARNIMFVLLNGETLGYIGSSKLAFDMTSTPSTFPNSKLRIGLSNVSHYLELNQLMTGDDTYHTYALNEATAPNARQLITQLRTAAGNFTLQVQNETSDLPPSSLRGILNELRNPIDQSEFGGIVVTDHSPAGFTNSFYNSRLDDFDNVNSTSTSIQQLCDFSSSLARALWAVADDVDASSVVMGKDQVNCSFVQELLECITVDEDCSLVKDSVGFVAKAGQPINRYIGVNRFVSSLSRPVAFFLNTLGNALATDRNVTQDNGQPITNCTSFGEAPKPQYLSWSDGRCVESYVYTHRAMSPAFSSGYVLKSVGTPEENYRDGRDPRWSTWTESVWGTLDATIYLEQSLSAQVANFVGGIVWFFLSIAFAWACSKYLSEARLPASEL